MKSKYVLFGEKLPLIFCKCKRKCSRYDIRKYKGKKKPQTGFWVLETRISYPQIYILFLMTLRIIRNAIRQEEFQTNKMQVRTKCESNHTLVINFFCPSGYKFL